MLYKLPTSADVDSERAQHPLVLAYIRLAVLLVFDVKVERFALQEYLEIGIML